MWWLKKWLKQQRDEGLWWNSKWAKCLSLLWKLSLGLGIWEESCAFKFLGSVPSLVRIKSGCIWPELSLKPGIWGGKYSQPFAVNSYKVVSIDHSFWDFSEIVGALQIQRLQMIQGRESVRKSERLFTGGSKEWKKRKKIQCYAEIFKESAC